MSSAQTARQVLDRNYLELRARLLEIAASLDRIDRAEPAGSIAHDPRLEQIRQGIALLGQSGSRRAEQIQMLFSDPYDPHWRGRSRES